MHTLRVLFYLVRLVLYRLLGLLHFFGKPGSRLIVPALLIGLVLLERPDLHILLRVMAWQLDHSLRPDWFILDAVLAVAVLVVACAYVLASRLLAVILGAFPVPKRPLPPLRKLKATQLDLTPAVVRVVVPALPRRA